MRKIINKIIKINDLKEIVKTNEKIAFGLCHGGFDLLHIGHIKHFESASKLCDKLIVSLTCDKFVKQRKGNNRPIYNENDRAYMIAAIEFVDFVIISPFKTGIEIIKEIKPTFYIKGPDYKNKNTPGIIEERKTIKNIGGKILYTDDEKFSTSFLIDKIQKVERKSLLLILDRDGTIIKEQNYLGKNSDWKENIILNRPVVDFLHFLEQNYKLTIIVVSNQSGVAWNFFDEIRVKKINSIINKLLLKEGIKIDCWEYSPEIDKKYALLKGLENFNPAYIKNKTTRKPNTFMVDKALNSLNIKKDEFNNILVLGDSEVDKILAFNLQAMFIDVKNKLFEKIKNEFINSL
jgi:rfaE bifunctional protein nucleotidyltransferase chain/domain